MKHALEARVSPPAGVLMRELGGEAILLNLDSESYYGLDEVSTRMWTALTTSGSIQAACGTLLAEYEVQPEKLRRDILDFTKELEELGLVEVSGG